MTRLPENLRSVSGEALLVALAAERDWRSLEAMWCYSDAALGARLVPLFLSSGQKHLVDLLVDEVIGGGHSGVPAVGLTRQLFDARSPATVAGAQRMLNALDAPPMENTEAADWGLAWLFEMDAACADNYAVELATLKVATQETVLRAAAARVGRLGAKRQEEVIGTLLEVDVSDPTRWSSVALVASEALRTSKSGRRHTLISRLLVQGATIHGLVWDDRFDELVHEAGTEAVLELYRSDAVDIGPQSQIGGNLMLSLVDASQGPQWQIDVAEAVAEHHPTLWEMAHRELTQTWDAAVWEAVIRRRIDRSTTGPMLAADSFLRDADESLWHLFPVFAATVDPDNAPGPACAAAADRLRARLSVAGDADAQSTELVHIEWPAECEEFDDSVLYATVAYVVTIATDELIASRAMARSCTAGALSAARLAELVPTAGWLPATQELEDDASCAAFVRALGRRDANAVGALAPLACPVDGQPDFAIVAGLAAVDSSTAFARFSDRWETLNEEERDRLVELLEEHAAHTELELLDRIVNDSERANAGRRLRACARWSALAPLRAPLPTGLASLLTSPRPEMRQAATEAIRVVRPRDAVTMSQLRELVGSGGATGDAAREALDSIDDDVADELSALRGVARRDNGPDLCGLLGLAAGPRSVALLAEHLGPNAHDEALLLRQSAAAALADVFEVRTAEPAHLTILGDLLHGANAETDVVARGSLGVAHRRAQLGEDAALSQLDDVLGADHRVADIVISGEKARLLDALQRKAAREALGEPGWDGYVAALDLILERVGRGAYILVGSSENLKSQMAGNPESPAWGRVIDALRNSPVQEVVPHLEVVHNLRSGKTDAHGSEEVLTATEVDYATQAFRIALPLLCDLASDALDTPALRVVDSGNAS